MGTSTGKKIARAKFKKKVFCPTLHYWELENGNSLSAMVQRRYTHGIPGLFEKKTFWSTIRRIKAKEPTTYCLIVDAEIAMGEH